MYSGNVRTVESGFMRLAYGISGKPKLLGYELHHLVRWGGILTAFTPGTILRVDDGVAKEMTKLLCVFVSSGLAAYFVYGREHLTELNTRSLQDLSKYMNGFVPFVLSLYVSLALKRWWCLRVQALGKLFDATANTVMLVSCALPGPRHQAVRDLVVKWGVASIFLLVKAAREPSGGGAETLCEDMLGKLSEEEVALLKGVSPYGRAMVMWAWIMRLAQETFVEAKGPAPHAPKLAQVFFQCLDARDGVQTIHTYLQTQLPFAYVHLITLTVNVNNLVVSLTCGIIFMVELSEGDTFGMLYQLLMFFLVPVLYHGLLSISYVIHDPFGEDMLDFPIAAFVEYVVQCCDAVLVAQEQFPNVCQCSLNRSTGEQKAVATGPTAAVTSAAAAGAEAAAQVAGDAFGRTSQAFLAELREAERRLHSIHDAAATSELRRKRDADRLCAGLLKPRPAAAPAPPPPSPRRLPGTSQPWCLNPEAMPAELLTR